MRKFLTIALLALALAGGAVAVSTFDAAPALADGSSNGGGGR
jgi:hypothetical protein